MKIDENTLVGKLLDEHPELLDSFIRVSPHFKKLENKFLRRTIARRVSISDAARVGGVDPEYLITALRADIGESTEDGTERGRLESEVEWGDDFAEEFDYDESQIQETLDVRDDIAANNDPLQKIMRTAKRIDRGRILHLVNSFEPIPLYDVLGKKGFVHATESRDGVFHVLFKRTDGAAESKRDTKKLDATGKDVVGDLKVVEMDVRGLEPPEPMMRILKALKALGANEILLVHHHREPVLLYDKLHDGGFEAVSNKVGENHYKVVIRRAAGGR